MKLMMFNCSEAWFNPGSLLSLSKGSCNSEVWDFFSSVFDISKSATRFGFGVWSRFHDAWVHTTSDTIIGLSFLVLAVASFWLIYRKRKKFGPFRTIMFLLTSLMFATGMVFLLDAAMVWWPAFAFGSLVRAVTAIMSLAAVVILFRMSPGLMELHTPASLEKRVEERITELQTLNHQSREEVYQRSPMDEKLKYDNEELGNQKSGLELTNYELRQREETILVSDEKIKELNQHLERKVEERTAQLNAINRELEAFTYSVSHDLRAPLRAIDGYARILEEDYNTRLDSQGKHLIGVITKNARYMGQLIDDLLEFSRTSRSEISKATFHTEEEVRKIVGDLMQLEKNRSVEIEVKPLATANGDIVMLRQVWINLISNALKYTRKNPAAKIEIGSLRFAEEVSFYVKDNGVGFDMEYTNKLFGVFQRLHKKDEFEGTGVGLALVKRILDRHNGKIWVEAALHKGATFYFSLPV